MAVGGGGGELHGCERLVVEEVVEEELHRLQRGLMRRVGIIIDSAIYRSLIDYLSKGSG